jgi:cell wall-associated NlpC family hydrolase
MKIKMIAIGVIAAALSTLAPGTALAGWGDVNCTDPGTLYTVATPTRAVNRSYYSYLDNEGYHWGGGCANDNNIDDQPNEALMTTDPRGEGPDCSGLVYRAWELADYGTNAGFFGKYQFAYVHGPWSASSFRSSNSIWTVVSKTGLLFFDALASTGHIGLYLGANGDGSGNYMEAKQESVGSGVFARTYRTDSAYTAARRSGWAG